MKLEVILLAMMFLTESNQYHNRKQILSASCIGLLSFIAAGADKQLDDANFVTS
jgi:hypothetical protein